MSTAAARGSFPELPISGSTYSHSRGPHVIGRNKLHITFFLSGQNSPSGTRHGSVRIKSAHGHTVAHVGGKNGVTAAANTRWHGGKSGANGGLVAANLFNSTRGPSGSIATIDAGNGNAAPSSGSSGKTNPFAAANIGNATTGPSGKLGTVNALNGNAGATGNSSGPGSSPAATGNVLNAGPQAQGWIASINVLNGAATPSSNGGTTGAATFDALNPGAGPQGAVAGLQRFEWQCGRTERRFESQWPRSGSQHRQCHHRPEWPGRHRRCLEQGRAWLGEQRPRPIAGGDGQCVECFTGTARLGGQHQPVQRQRDAGESERRHHRVGDRQRPEPVDGPSRKSCGRQCSQWQRRKQSYVDGPGSRGQYRQRNPGSER